MTGNAGAAAFLQARIPQATSLARATATWGKIGGSPFTVLRNTTFTHNFGIAPRFGRGIYRFTYERFHSGDSGPPKLKICRFDVVAP